MKKPLYKNITGEMIRAARRFRDDPISQVELAQRVSKRGLSLDQTGISKIERRQRSVTDYELLAFARCLGCSVNEFFRNAK